MQDKQFSTTNGSNSEGANASADLFSSGRTDTVIADIQQAPASTSTSSSTPQESFLSNRGADAGAPALVAAGENQASATQLTSPPVVPSPKSHSLGFLSLKPLLIAGVFVLGLSLAGFLGYKQLSSQNQQNAISTDPAAAYDIQKLDLQDLADTSSLGLATSQSLSVNGQLRTNNSLVLAPTAQPTAGSATAGQLYYDREGNVLAYYNGTQFVDVASADQFEALQAQLQAVTGSIPVVPTLPADIATLGATNTFQSLNTFSGGLATSSFTTGSLSVASSANLQGSLDVTGATSLGATTASSLVLSSPLTVSSGGTGASILNANGVVLGNGTSPLTTANYTSASQCLMSPISGVGAPVFDTCPGGIGAGVTSLNGLAGNLTIANATGVGTTVTLNDATTASKGIASFNATNFSVVSGSVNTVQDIGTTASPTFAAVTAGSLTGNGAGITNVNAASLGGNTSSYFTNATNISTGTLADGRLSANVTLAGNTFNGLGQLVQLNGSGQLPALSGALLTNLNATSVVSGSLADARLSANVALLGAPTANFIGTLQQAGNTVCDVSNNCNYLTGAAANGSYIQLQATTPGTAQTGNFNISGTGRAATLYQNGSQVCDMSGNCTGLGGELTGSGTAGTLAVFTGTGSSLGDSLLSQTGLTVTVGGTLAATALSGNGAAVTNVNASQLNGQAASYYLNATNISAGTLADARLSANIPLLNSATNNFTGTLQQGGNAVCNASNNCNYLTQLTANDIYLQLQAATPGVAQTGNFNISGTGRAATLYQNGSQVCDMSGNCTGLGGELTGSGTPGTLTIFTGTGASLGDSILSQAATTVTVAGTLSATALAGNGAGVTSVNAAQLNGQAASYYLNATNISTGTLADARLSANVTVQGNTFNGANQLVQLDVSGQLPAVSGALVTSLNGSNVASGTVADARLSANVALLNSAANFTGVLQHNGSTVCDISNNCGYLTGSAASGSYVELQSTTPGTAQTGNLNITGTVIAGALYQGANQVCDTSGNCAGAGGGLVGSGTAGTIAKFTASGTLGNSILTENLTTVTVGGTLAATALTGNGSGVTNVNASQLNGQAASYYLNATNISTGTLADARLSANVALLGAVTANFTGTLQRAGNNVCDTSNNCGYLTGAAADGDYIQLQATTPGTAQTGNFNISGAGRAASLYQNGNQVCDTSGNCTGLGGEITGSGTPGTLAMFTGTGDSLGDSILAQSLTTVTVGGTLAATTLTGNGSGVTNVNASQLNGQAASYYLNATNISSGTLADARLSANVALLDAVTNNFTGTVQGAALNATSSIQLNGVNINTAGTLSNVAYLDQTNTFSAANTFSTSVTTPLVQGAVGGALTLTGNAASTWSTSAGNLTLQAGSGTISLGSTTALTNTGALTVTGGTTLALRSTTTNAISLDSGSTGAINIGTGANAKTLTIGNTTGATALLLRSGTGNISLTGTTTVTGAATVTGNLIGNSGLYTGTSAGTLRISSTGVLSNVSMGTSAGVVVTAPTTGSLSVATGTSGQCLLSNGTASAPSFGSCSSGGGWDLTGTNAAGSILGSNVATSANFVISSRPNNVAATSSGASYISFSGHQFSSPNRIIIAGNPNSNSNQGGGAWSSGNNADYFRIQNSAGDVAFAVQGSAATQQVFVNLMAASSVGANGKVCSTIAQGSSGMGTLAACSSGVDLAEAYNSTQALVPGEIVAVDPDNYPNVLRSNSVSQENLMGIVSTEPDHVMGQDKAPNGYPIALNGRVPTKVNAEGGPILPGDKITSSSVPGVGKKATGRGMIVGTALTGYSGTGQGVIEVFVHLDYYEPSQIDMLQANAANIGDLNVSGTSTLNNLVVTGNTTVHTISVKGHIITSSGQPVAQTSVAAGAGATVVIDGNDTAGTIKITTGATGLVMGDLAAFSFSEIYGKVPRIVMTGQDGVSVKASIYPSGKTLEGFMLQTSEVLLPNTTYTFDYFIVE